MKDSQETPKGSVKSAKVDAAATGADYHGPVEGVVDGVGEGSGVRENAKRCARNKV